MMSGSLVSGDDSGYTDPMNRQILDDILVGCRTGTDNLSLYRLAGTNLEGADFTDIGLNGVDFSSVDLTGAIGLPTAPVVDDLDQLIYDSIQAGGLDMEVWHDSCGTAHCRAGWAIHLAGKEGAELECRFGPSVAGALIYYASTGRGQIPNWYDTDDEALADIKRLVTT
jgi:hypothetical protein